jgi:hypothetical protein
MSATLTIPIQGNLWNLLKNLGEPAALVPAALRQYMVDLSTRHGPAQMHMGAICQIGRFAAWLV